MSDKRSLPLFPIRVLDQGTVRQIGRVAMGLLGLSDFSSGGAQGEEDPHRRGYSQSEIVGSCRKYEEIKGEEKLS